MVSTVLILTRQTMNVTVVMSTLEYTVKLPLITVLCLLSAVTMEVVWMILEISPVNVIQDSRETSVTLILMNVKQLDARMGNVKSLLMHFSVHAIQDGLEFFVIQISTIVLWTLLGLDHVTTLEQVPVLMVTPHTHVSVWMAMLVMIAPWTLILVILSPARMVEHVPTHPSLLLNAPV